MANPMPDFSHKFEPQLPHRKTEIEPFAFEERYKDKPTRETLVQQILRREKVGSYHLFYYKLLTTFFTVFPFFSARGNRSKLTPFQTLTYLDLCSHNNQ